MLSIWMENREVDFASGVVLEVSVGVLLLYLPTMKTCRHWNPL